MNQLLWALLCVALAGVPAVAQAQAYLDGPIVAGMRANPNVADLTTVLSDVRERMSAITHAPVPGLDAIIKQAAE